MISNLSKKKLNMKNCKFLINITLSYQRKLSIGDKICNRCANKSVVSAILPESEMPFVKSTGQTLEAIINPLGIISRQNYGQLTELHLGKIYMYLKDKAQQYLLNQLDSSEFLKKVSKYYKLPKDSNLALKSIINLSFIKTNFDKMDYTLFHSLIDDFNISLV